MSDNRTNRPVVRSPVATTTRFFLAFPKNRRDPRSGLVHRPRVLVKTARETRRRFAFTRTHRYGPLNARYKNAFARPPTHGTSVPFHFASLLHRVRRFGRFGAAVHAPYVTTDRSISSPNACAFPVGRLEPFTISKSGWPTVVDRRVFQVPGGQDVDGVLGTLAPPPLPAYVRRPVRLFTGVSVYRSPRRQ